ncbi:unnamed protein product [Rhizoctonia solani]|uniref:Uncharacterized protein n=1 Tax=Rhizoctonia solani TaxID=456999 RepID=A0A8H3BCE9_9AGAM|nr:unnamed protein product [Rhizoctonia solani]
MYSVMSMIGEQGTFSLVAQTTGSNLSSTQSNPSNPPSTASLPDPNKIDKLLSEFIQSLIDEDERDSPDESDSDLVTESHNPLEPKSDYDSNLELESELESESGLESELESGSELEPELEIETEFKPGSESGSDVEDMANISAFEPIFTHGRLNNSSIYNSGHSGDFRMNEADQLSQIELSMAELSMGERNAISPDIVVAEPTGEHSFLQDSPASSDRTSSTPQRFLDNSMIDSRLTNHPDDNSGDYYSPCDEMNNAEIPPENSVDRDSTPSDESNVFDSPSSGPQWGMPIGECHPLLHRLHQEKIEAGLTPAYPFADWLEFEFVKWMVERDISQTSREKLLKLPIIASRAGLSFGSNYTLNKLLDRLPLAGPKWEVKAIKVTGDKLGPDGKHVTEIVELWHRDILGVIRELLENLLYGKDLVFAPCEEWNDEERTERKYEEMWTGDWWRKLQTSGLLPPNATIIPVILASDATNLTKFGGGKQAYPVYITLGNIPKGIRRKPSMYGTLLLGYLPAQKLECFTEKGKTHQKERLFHQCMAEIVRPLEQAGREGVEMACGDGEIRKCFPILAAYSADNPEQTQIACCKKNLCYRCTVGRDERGDYVVCPDRHHINTANALIARSKHRLTQYYIDNGLRPFGRPFWANLPHCDIFSALTPDILHQLHKGVFKDHLMKWCLELVNQSEFNDLYKAMLRHSNLRHFDKNVSELSQTTGKEHREMEKVFVGVVAGLVPDDVMPAVRALLDFIYYAQLPSHTETTISWLERSLASFHEHKDAFIRHGARKHFNINKLHSMMHYATAIRELGALDGYNTEGPERLHIDFAKRAYRATNRNDFIVQMVQYLERRERVFKFDNYLKWAIPEYAAAEKIKDEVWAAKRPVTQDQIKEIFDVRWFSWVMDDFFKREFDRSITIDPLDSITVYPKATQYVLDDITLAAGFPDIIHASPHFSPSRVSLKESGGRFDTVFIQANGVQANLSYGIGRHVVGQVRMIFTLPQRYGIPDPLVCVRTFRTPTNALPVRLTGMHRVTLES